MPIVFGRDILRDSWERVADLPCHEQILAWLNLFQDCNKIFGSIQKANPGKMQGIILVDWQNGLPESYLPAVAGHSDNFRKFTVDTSQEFALVYKSWKHMKEALERWQKKYPTCGLAFWKHPNTLRSNLLDVLLRKKEQEMLMPAPQAE